MNLLEKPNARGHLSELISLSDEALSAIELPSDEEILRAFQQGQVDRAEVELNEPPPLPSSRILFR